AQWSVVDAQRGSAYYEEKVAIAQAGQDEIYPGLVYAREALALAQSDYDSDPNGPHHATELAYWKQYADAYEAWYAEAAEYTQSMKTKSSEADTYLGQMRTKQQEASDYVSWRTRNLNTAVNLLRRFQDARDEVLELQNNIAVLAQKLHEKTRALHEEKEEVIRDAKEIADQNSTLRLPLLSEEELNALISSRDPQGYLGAFLSQEILGGDALVQSVYEKIGKKTSAHVDLFSVGIQCAEGTPTTSSSGAIVDLEGKNYRHLVGVAFEQRYQSQQVWDPKSSKAKDNVTYKDWKQSRLALFDVSTIDLSKDTHLTYVGYADIAVGKDADGNNVNHVQTIQYKTRLARKWFADLRLNSAFTSSQDSLQVESWDTTGKSIYIPTDVVVKEKLLNADAGIIWEDGKGRTWRTFIRPERDISKWAPKKNYLYVGTEVRTPVGFLSIEDVVETSFGAQGMYDVSSSGSGMYKAGASLSVEFASGYEFSVKGMANGKYDTKDIEFGLTVPVPWTENVALKAGITQSTSQGGSVNGLGFAFGPTFYWGKSKNVLLPGITTNSPLTVVGPYIPQVVNFAQIRINSPDCVTNQFSFCNADGRPFIPGPVAKAETALLEKTSLGVRLDGAKSLELTSRQVAHARPINKLTKAQLQEERIEKRDDGYYGEVKADGKTYWFYISDLKGEATVLPRTYVAKNFGEIESPVIVRYSLPDMEQREKDLKALKAGTAFEAYDEAEGLIRIVSEAALVDAFKAGRLVYEHQAHEVDGVELFPYYIKGETDVVYVDGKFDEMTDNTGKKYLPVRRPVITRNVSDMSLVDTNISSLPEITRKNAIVILQDKTARMVSLALLKAQPQDMRLEVKVILSKSQEILIFNSKGETIGRMVQELGTNGVSSPLQMVLDTEMADFLNTHLMIVLENPAEGQLKGQFVKVASYSDNQILDALRSLGIKDLSRIDLKGNDITRVYLGLEAEDVRIEEITGKTSKFYLPTDYDTNGVLKTDVREQKTSTTEEVCNGRFMVTTIESGANEGLVTIDIYRNVLGRKPVKETSRVMNMDGVKVLVDELVHFDDKGFETYAEDLLKKEGTTLSINGMNVDHVVRIAETEEAGNARMTTSVGFGNALTITQAPSVKAEDILMSVKNAPYNNVQVFNPLRDLGMTILSRMDAKGHDVTRVYLGANEDDMSIEEIVGNTSKFYLPTDYDAHRVLIAGAKEQKTSETQKISDKTFVVTSTELGVNEGRSSKDVYRRVLGGKPVQESSQITTTSGTDVVQNELVHFDDKGFETYAEDLLKKDGTTLVVHGVVVDNVVRIAQTEKIGGVNKTTSVSFKNFRENGGVALVTGMELMGSRRLETYTGVIKGYGVKAQEVLATAKAAVATYRDHQNADRSRVISIDPHKDATWETGWTIGRARNEALSENLFNSIAAAFAKDKDAEAEFKKLKLEAGVVLSKTPVMFPNNVSSDDYRWMRDIAARKLITSRFEAGQTVETIVGVLFHPNGEQLRSYKIEGNDITGIFEYMVGNKLPMSLREQIGSNRAGDIFKDKVAEAMVRAFEKRMPTTFSKYGTGVAGFWKFMNEMGITKNTRLTIIREYPKLVLSEEVVNGRTIKHYSDNQYGKAKYHFLIPNDSRGRDVGVLYADNTLELQLWALEGKTDILVKYNGDKNEKALSTPQVGLRPGSIIADLKNLSEAPAVQMLRMPAKTDAPFSFAIPSVSFGLNKFTKDMNHIVARVSGGNGQPLTVTYADGYQVTAYEYMTMDSKLKVSQYFTPAGRSLAEKFGRVTSLPMLHYFGKTMLGEEITVLDVRAQVRRPLAAYWDGGDRNNPTRQEVKFFNNDKTVYEIKGGRTIDGGSRIVDADQMTYEYAWEGAGFDASKFSEQRSPFKNGELDVTQGGKSTPDLLKKWVHNYGVLGTLAGGLAALVLGLLALGKKLGWLGQMLRWFSYRNETAVAEIHLQHSRSEIAAILKKVQDFPTVGFQAGGVKQAKKAMIKELRARLNSGYSVEESLERFFRNYRQKFFIPVMKKVLGAESEEYKDHLKAIDNFGLFEMYLYNMIKMTSDKTANVTSTPDFYRFYLALQWKKSGMPLDEIGQKIEFEEAALWSVLLWLHQRVAKATGGKTNADVIHHDDVEGLFAYPEFLRNYRKPDAAGKTYNDRFWDEVVRVAIAANPKIAQVQGVQAQREAARDYFRTNPGMTKDVAATIGTTDILGKIYPDIKTVKFGLHGWARVIVNFGRRLTLVLGPVGITSAGLLWAYGAPLSLVLGLMGVAAVMTVGAYYGIKYVENNLPLKYAIVIFTLAAGLFLTAGVLLAGAPTVSWGLVWLAGMGATIALGALLYRGVKHIDHSLNDLKAEERWKNHVKMEERAGKAEYHTEPGYENRKEIGGRTGRKARAWLFMGLATAFKAVMNFFIWSWLFVPLKTAAMSTWMAGSVAIPFGGPILAAIGLSTFVSIFLLDIFAYYYLVQSGAGYLIAKFMGNNRVDHWNKDSIVSWAFFAAGLIGVAALVFSLFSGVALPGVVMTALAWIGKLWIVNYAVAILFHIPMVGPLILSMGGLKVFCWVMTLAKPLNMILSKLGLERIGNDSVEGIFGAKMVDGKAVFTKHGAMRQFMKKLVPPTKVVAYAPISEQDIVTALRNVYYSRLRQTAYNQLKGGRTDEGYHGYALTRGARKLATEELATKNTEIKTEAAKIYAALKAAGYIDVNGNVNKEAVKKLKVQGLVLQGFGDKDILEAVYWAMRYQRRSIEEAERMIRTARAWNASMDALLEDDVADITEHKDYRFEFDATGKNITKVPDLRKAPSVWRVADRLQKTLSSYFMGMRHTPIWEAMYNFSVILPFLNEPVLYPFSDKDIGEYEGINAKYDTGATFLTYINNKKPKEWTNFIARMIRDTDSFEARANAEADPVKKQKMLREVAARRADIKLLEALKYGERLGYFDPAIGRHRMHSGWMETQVRLWASYRFQPMGRSTRGIMRYREMYDWLARTNFPDEDAAQAMAEQMFPELEVSGNYEENIGRLVDEKFEYLVGHQPYGGWLTSTNEADKICVADMNFELGLYPSMKLAYLHNLNPSLSFIEGVNAHNGRFDRRIFEPVVDRVISNLGLTGVDAGAIRAPLLGIVTEKQFGEAVFKKLLSKGWVEFDASKQAYYLTKDFETVQPEMKKNKMFSDDELKSIQAAWLRNSMPGLSNNRVLRERLKAELLAQNDQLYIDNFAGATAEFRLGEAKAGEDILTMMPNVKGEQGRIVRTNVIELYSHYFAGQGKPVNQNNLGRFVTGDIMQLMDINQDFYLEETFKAPAMQENFRDEDVFIVGFPEDIITDDFSPAGRVHGLGDHTFVTITQRSLNFKGIRFHYGHPDMVRVMSFRQLGLFSAPWVNEDIFGAYKGTMLGEKVLNSEIMQAAKAREVVNIGLLGISNKFGAGAAEQAIGQRIAEFNHSNLIGAGRSYAHMIGAIGYFLRKPIILIQNTLYMVAVGLVGVSFFIGFPSELMWGLIGLMLSQAIGSSGWFQLVLERGFLQGTIYYMRIFPLLMITYMGLIYSAFATGVKMAYKNLADYVATGRRAGRHHYRMFLDTIGWASGEQAKQGDLYVNVNQPGLSFAIPAVMILTAGIVLWKSVGLIWSVLPIMLVVAILFAPFLLNAGSTPATVGVKTWWGQHVKDVKFAFAKFGGLLRYLGDNNYRSDVAKVADPTDIKWTAQQKANMKKGLLWFVALTSAVVAGLILNGGIPFIGLMIFSLVVYPLVGVMTVLLEGKNFKGSFGKKIIEHLGAAKVDKGAKLTRTAETLRDIFNLYFTMTAVLLLTTALGLVMTVIKLPQHAGLWLRARIPTENFSILIPTISWVALLSSIPALVSAVGILGAIGVLLAGGMFVLGAVRVNRSDAQASLVARAGVVASRKSDQDFLKKIAENKADVIRQAARESLSAQKEISAAKKVLEAAQKAADAKAKEDVLQAEKDRVAALDAAWKSRQEALENDLWSEADPVLKTWVAGTPDEASAKKAWLNALANAFKSARQDELNMALPPLAEGRAKALTVDVRQAMREIVMIQKLLEDLKKGAEAAKKAADEAKAKNTPDAAAKEIAAKDSQDFVDSKEKELKTRQQPVVEALWPSVQSLKDPLMDVNGQDEAKAKKAWADAVMKVLQDALRRDIVIAKVQEIIQDINIRKRAVVNNGRLDITLSKKEIPSDMQAEFAEALKKAIQIRAPDVNNVWRNVPTDQLQIIFASVHVNLPVPDGVPSKVSINGVEVPVSQADEAKPAVPAEAGMSKSDSAASAASQGSVSSPAEGSFFTPTGKRYPVALSSPTGKEADSVKSTQKERLLEVNADGIYTGQQVLRREAHQKGIWHRTIRVVVFNARGQVLRVFRGGRQKQAVSGRFDVSVAGHNGLIADPCEAALKEISEEIFGGRSLVTKEQLIPLGPGRNFVYRSNWNVAEPDNREFFDSFGLILDDRLALQVMAVGAEADGHDWIGFDEMLAEVAAKPERYARIKRILDYSDLKLALRNIHSRILATAFSGISEVGQEKNHAFPASVPTGTAEDRAATSVEFEKIMNAFGGAEVLAAKGITLTSADVIMSDRLARPAEFRVRDRKLLVNPLTLRGPPEQLRVIFEGHELFHMLYPERSEGAARRHTLRYLVENELLLKHYRLLHVNSFGLKADPAWAAAIHLLYVVSRTHLVANRAMGWVSGWGMPLWRRLSTKSRDLGRDPVSVEEKIAYLFKYYDLGLKSPDELRYSELFGGIPTRRPLLIETPRGQFVLKIAGMDRDKARFVLSSHMKAFESGLPVPQVLKTRSGSLFVQIGSWYYFLEQYISSGGSRSFPRAAPVHFSAMGELVARLHNAIGSFKPEGATHELGPFDIVTARSELIHRKEELDQRGRSLTRGQKLFRDNFTFLSSQLDTIAFFWTAEKERAMPMISAAHYDVSIGNIKWEQDARILTLFDWERARGPCMRLEDFKNPVLAAGAEHGRIYDRSKVLAFLKSYQLYIQRKMEQAEIETIPLLLGGGTFLWDMAKWFLLSSSDLDTNDRAFHQVEAMLVEFRRLVEDFRQDWWRSEQAMLSGAVVGETIRTQGAAGLVQMVAQGDLTDALLLVMHVTSLAAYNGLAL
ncbi:MAG: hypothetical protein HQL21_01180, partial [Candidatus Omnitrophica bacterium]|nr:hypothetical protein [Candidatus Omnitrophota bacterium]